MCPKPDQAIEERIDGLSATPERLAVLRARLIEQRKQQEARAADAADEAELAALESRIKGRRKDGRET